MEAAPQSDFNFALKIEYKVQSVCAHHIFSSHNLHVCKQTIGIPMGTDCAPLPANLFLSFYEYKHVKDKLKTNPRDLS